LLSEVSYAPARLEVDFEREAKNPRGVSNETVQRLLTTKFIDWKYEEEVRMFVRPEEVVRDGELQFFPFREQLALRAVYIGPRCTVTPSELKSALCAEEQRAYIHATRLAFKSFHVIRTPWRPGHGT